MDTLVHGVICQLCYAVTADPRILPDRPDPQGISRQFIICRSCVDWFDQHEVHDG